MTTIDHYQPGQFCWADLTSRDVERSKAFYRETMGWDFESFPTPDGPAYTQCLVNRQPVMGMSPASPNNPESVALPWNCYVAVASVDETLKQAQALGAQVAVAPTDVMAAGRMAILRDRQGARLGLWQAREHKGAAIMNELGAICWTELATIDAGPATDFYGKLFGWEFLETNLTPRGYKQIKLNGKPMGAILTMNEDWREGSPAQWNPYFLVPDCRVTTARAVELGSRIFEKPSGAGGSMFAIYVDALGVPMRIMSRKPRTQSA